MGIGGKMRTTFSDGCRGLALGGDVWPTQAVQEAHLAVTEDGAIPTPPPGEAEEKGNPAGAGHRTEKFWAYE